MNVTVEVADVPHNGVVRIQSATGLHLAVAPNPDLDAVAAALFDLSDDERANARQALVEARILPKHYAFVDVGEGRA